MSVSAAQFNLLDARLSATFLTVFHKCWQRTHPTPLTMRTPLGSSGMGVPSMASSSSLSDVCWAQCGHTRRNRRWAIMPMRLWASRKGGTPRSLSRDTEPMAYYLQVLADKTGVLIATAARYGAMFSGCTDEQVETLREYGELIGIVFQLSDDILDVTQASSTLGKTAGKDVEADKPTYVSVLGLDAARRHAEDLRRDAHAALTRSGLRGAGALAALADRVVERQS